MNWIQKLIEWIRSLLRHRMEHVKSPTSLGSPQIPQPNIYFNGDWSPYITSPYDNQYHGFDFNNCVTQSGIHTIEMILNYLFKNKQLPQPLYDFLADTNNNYLNPQGYIELSVRYNSVLNGTTKEGLAMDTFWQCVNRDGIVPRSLYPDPEGSFLWSDYYQPVPEPIKALGLKAAAIFQWNWQAIVSNNWDAPDTNLLKETLRHSPLHWTGMLCFYDSNNFEKWCGIKVYEHARVIYNISDYINVLDSEFKINPLKKLELINPIPFAIKVSLVIS